MKNLLSLLFLVLLSWNLPAQCPAGDVILTSQAEVDAFVVTYPNCTEISGDLQIGLTTSGVSDITSLTGLNALASIDGMLLIRSNLVLPSLTGLEGLNSIDGDLRILGNDALPSLTGLEGLNFLGANLLIQDNDSLVSLMGLENMDATGISNMFISFNDQLSTCAVESICTYLGVEMGVATISFNATGCDSQAEVEMACNTPTCPEGNVILETQAEIDEFVATYPNCSEISGNLQIGQTFGTSEVTDVIDLTGLTAITSVSGYVFIGFHDVLTSLAGLDNLSFVGGDLTITANDVLASLAGLDAIVSLGGDLRIQSNDALTSLTGLDALTSVGGDLRVNDNDALLSLTGLDAITSVGGDLRISNHDNLPSLSGLESITSIGRALGISDNSSLTSLAALEAITTVNGFLFIGGNTSLTSLTGLDAITTVTSDLIISDNAALTSLSGLEAITSIGGALTISNNASLVSIAGVENIDPLSIPNVLIEDNTQLATCAIENICAFLGVEMDAAVISGNALGCANREQVEVACTAADVCSEAFDISPLLGQGIGTPQTSILISNVNNAATNTPTAGLECHAEMDPVTHTAWLRFTGDGNTYRFTTVQCAASSGSYLSNTQFALYSGACDELVAEACNEDEDSGSNLLNAEIDQFTTVAGTEYFLLVDGFSASTGEFCLEVTRQMTVDVTDISQTAIVLFPNPTSGRLQWRNVNAERVEVFTAQGSRVAQYQNPTQEVDLSVLPAGVYYLQLLAADGTYVARVVKE